MPQVKEGLEKAFPQFTGKIRLQDPHLAVAKGAAIYAAKAQMSDVDYGYSTPAGTIINTASMSYGIDAVDLDQNGKIIDTYVAILITKGMQLPATVSSTFCTIGPTNKMKIQVFEYKQEAADRVRIEQATKLGKESGIVFERQVPKDTPVEVTFHLSNDGLLTVTANSKVDSGHVEFTLDINGTMTTGQKAIAKDLLRKV